MEDARRPSKAPFASSITPFSPPLRRELATAATRGKDPDVEWEGHKSRESQRERERDLMSLIHSPGHKLYISPVYC